MASLIIFEHDKFPREIPLVKTVITAGADPDCDIPLNGAGIAAVHLKVIRQGNVFMAWPFEKNAIYVNCKKVKKAELEDMDRIIVGRSLLIFSMDDGLLNRRETLARDPVDTLASLRDFSMDLMRIKDVNRLLDTLLDRVVELSRANKGFIILLQEDSRKVVAARNIGRKDVNPDQDLFSDTIVQKVIQTGEPQLVVDAGHHKEFSACTSVVNLRLTSVAALPLRVENIMLGVLYLGTDEIIHSFDQALLSFLMVFASQASLILQNALLMEKMRVDNMTLRKELQNRSFGQVIGACKGMQEVFRLVERVAPTDVSVLIQGETGTGKELIAKEIHKRSKRAKGPFMAINCGAIPEALLESELFGHVRGAFTGAVSTTKGKFQAAHRGTLFLDEIGELPLGLQVKLLRVLQDMNITKVGSQQTQKVDVRVVAATNINIREAIKEKSFREDLYYRLAVVEIGLPPLRKRDRDIILLARYYLERYAKELGSKVKGFSKDATDAMMNCNWPGNVRELENRVKRALLFAEGTMITREDLEIPSDREVMTLTEARERFELQYVMEVLNNNGGNRTKTAQDLGVDQRTVYRYIDKMQKQEDGQP